jgi:hypothetical protein
MKVSFLIIGILIIIGAVVDHAVTPKAIDELNSFTNHLATSVLPTTDNTQANSVFASSLIDLNSKVAQFQSDIAMMEKIFEYSYWAIALVGISTVLYGVFSKNNRNQVYLSIMHNSEALGILKKRLAKGEITEKEFGSIKQYIQ